MEKLIAEQEVTGKEIRRIISNVGKDPAQRKTFDYYQERLRRLEEAWEQFESTDTEIRNHPDVQPQDDYFISDYYTSIASLHSKYKELFEAQIQVLSSTIEARKASTQIQTPSSNLDARKAPITQESDSARDNPIRQLLRKANTIRGQLDHVLHRLMEAPSGQSTAFYQVQKQAVSEYWQQLEAVHHQICEAVDDPESLGYDVKGFFCRQDQVLSANVSLTGHLQPSGPQQIPINDKTLRSDSSMKIKLPKIEIPKFDGNYLNWRQFYDLFSEVVHKQDISPCEKLWYLRANLSGEAENLIKHLPLSNENYSAAWQILKERYENPRLIANALLSNLLGQSSHTIESAANIKSLHDTTREYLKGLENVGISTTGWDPLLLFILIRKLNKTTHVLYEQSLAHPRQLQTIKGLLSFLENRFQSLEALGSKPKAEDEKRSASAMSLTAVTNNICIACNASHPLFACKTFLTLTPENRLKLIQKHSKCVNCLQADHASKNCTRGTCRHCSKKHNTLLHLDKKQDAAGKKAAQRPKFETSASTTKQGISIKQEGEASSLATGILKPQAKYMMLSTVIVTIQGNDGTNTTCRAVSDSGSQVNLLSERVCQKLKLIKDSSNLKIFGIGNGRQHSTSRVNFLLKSQITAFTTRVEAHVLPRIISQQPSREINLSDWRIPDNIKLADPHFYRPDKIDLLLGVEFYYQLLSIGQIKLGENLPTLQNTVFGWIIGGCIGGKSSDNITCGVGIQDDAISQQVERFWNLDNLPQSKQHLSPNEKLCEAHFARWTKHNADGRYEVSLPFTTDPSTLGESKDMALRRFYSLERKLARQPNLQRENVKFMDEYLALGHMEEITEVPSIHYYLPHHCVTKPDSVTTKVRVVFDASAKTTSNVALNDILRAGPTVQEDLFSILLRFRQYRYVLTADIEKMYRQVSINPDQRSFQLIFWRRSPEEPMKQYQLNTVTYGTRPASYLATKCLVDLARKNQSEFPYASQALLQNCYVDDIMTGSNSMPELLKTQSELKALLSQAGFNLRKWCANDKRQLDQIPPQDIQLCLNFNESSDDYIKTLGLTWSPTSDVFKIKLATNSLNRYTKRSVASDIFSIFDPLGFLAPIVTTAKIQLQAIWKLKLDWDAALPMEMQTRWTIFREELKTIEDMVISRHMYSHSLPKSRQLHIFADASTEAFGAAAYIRSVKQDNVIVVRLLCAKSHVAPIKTITLPRLELCAAKLAAELADRIKQILNMTDIPTYYWTDSQIVLSWIQSQSSDFHTFVANRIGAIHELSNPEQWRHVETKKNPADVLTRPIAPSQFKTYGLWFRGPIFLHGSEKEWPAACEVHATSVNDVERKITSLAATTSTNFVFEIGHKNSFGRLLRITGYVLRFINRCKKRTSENLSPTLALTQLERQQALRIIVKAIQSEDFKSEIRDLQQHHQLHKSSPLSNLTPFLDEHGILRVGGRLDAANLPFEAKHPMLLPYLDNITRLIVEDIHRKHSHVGPQGLEAITKQKFWPIKCKTLARSIVHKCVKCTRANPKLLSQIMGNLPAPRVQSGRPFINTGVDFCGPVYYHFQIRGKRPQKTYIAVFCCFATKAVHLELVSNLSTEAFLGALKRFIERRGHCRRIYCDNATNFVGARNQLQEISTSIYSDSAQNTITNQCSEKGIDFHFIPPRAPHFGGLWEAAVKSAKELMKKTIEPASLTHETLLTVLVEIEAILNSRPLTPLSSDPNDLTALTPGHFLIGEPLTAQIDCSAESKKSGLLSAWREINSIKREFWQRWSKEYLHLLQNRYGWKKAMTNVPIDTIVIIKDDNIPVMKWPLGRIIRTYKGNDGFVRVVDLKTENILTRPIHRLAPLPTESATFPEILNSSAEIDEETRNQPPTIAVKDPQPRRKQHCSSDKNPQSEGTPSKRKKLSRGALLTTLFACLLMPTSYANPAKFEAQRFNNTFGVNFENIGTIFHVTDEWKIIVYYDLSPYWDEMTSFSNATTALQRLCDLTIHKSNCEHLLLQFEQDQRELKLDNSLLTMKRMKRGALNVVGNLANSLFGVLDSKYAEEMSATINNVKTDQHHLMKLLRNQTSVVDSTINLIKIDQTSAQQKFSRIEEKINLILQRIDANDTADTQQRIFQTMTTLCLQLVAMSANLHRIQSTIIDVLTDAHHGTLSPLLLSPQQLHEELKNIKGTLPTGSHLPGYNDDVLILYQLMKTAGRIMDNYVIFTVRIPLNDKRNYQLFNLTPVPVIVNKTLVSIKLSTKLLAVNAHQDTYFTMTEAQLNTCLTIENQSLLCDKAGLVHHTGAQFSSCEMNLLTAESTQTCQTEIIPLKHTWMQLAEKNKWIFGLTEQMRLQVVCGNQNFKLQLDGAGILTLEPDCVMKHDSVTISGRNVISSQVNSSFKGRNIVIEIPSPFPTILLPGDDEEYQPQRNLLNDLQQTLRKEAFEFPTHTSHQSVSYHAIPGYVSIILILVIMSGAFWKCQNSSRKQKPIPAPRAYKKPDFSIEIQP